MGRVLRSKYDYGLMIFADQRYERQDKKGKLPSWIQNQTQAGNISLSVDMAIRMASEFFKSMGQPFEIPQKDLYDSQRLRELNNQ